MENKEPEARVLILIPPDVLSDVGQTRVFLSLGSLAYTEAFLTWASTEAEEQKAASVTSTVTSLSPWRSGRLPWAALRREQHGRTKDGGGGKQQWKPPGSPEERPVSRARSSLTLSELAA